MTTYYRPIVRTDHVRPDGALPLAGGWTWFDMAEEITRDGPPRLIHASNLPAEVRDRLTAPRTPICGLGFDSPRLMGILNVTPDSFSDGGHHNAPDRAIAHSRAMVAAGADMIDVGGESTRPGSEPVPIDDEIARTAPVIAAIRAAKCPCRSPSTPARPRWHRPLVRPGPRWSTTWPASPSTTRLPRSVRRMTCRSVSCILRARPETMQIDPRYDHPALDIYDWLSQRVEALVATGIARDQIIVDPGIGFGKTRAHNLTLLQNLSLFHGLGCPVLLGASRKRFIGDLSGVSEASERVPGSLAVALAGVAQGMQMLRIHDVAETAAAIRLWRAATEGVSE